MTSAMRTKGLTKLYGRHPGLTDVNLDIPAGRVVGLVGPSGAGKSTLLGLTCGIIEPTSGSIEVLGARPAVNAAQLAKVGFVAQDTPLYAGLSVADHLRLGARLNKSWDNQLARWHIQQVGLNPTQKAGHLSGSQRAQLALVIAAAKRPQLLIFDEPVAALDPLAHHRFLQNLMEFVSELAVTVVLSSHLLSDIEQVCDYFVLLAASKVQLAGEVDDLVSSHFRLVASRNELAELPAEIEVITAEHNGRLSTLIVRRTRTTPIPQSFRNTESIDLEELALAYMARAASAELNYSVTPHRPEKPR